jgi:hypothetical protein
MHGIPPTNATISNTQSGEYINTEEPYDDKFYLVVWTACHEVKEKEFPNQFFGE